MIVACVVVEVFLNGRMTACFLALPYCLGYFRKDDREYMALSYFDIHTLEQLSMNLDARARKVIWGPCPGNCADRHPSLHIDNFNIHFHKTFEI